MADIRKRINSKGEISYQVRYANHATKSSYAYKSFPTMKQARYFREDSRKRDQDRQTDIYIKTVAEAVDEWLVICEKEGRDGRDPITPYTLKEYTRRAKVMKSYDWPKHLQALTSPDVIAFRSWLLKSNISRYSAHKVLSSFYAVMKEMTLRGIIATNIAADITIRAESRYDTPVIIPTVDEVRALLSAADRLAASTNKRIAKTWARYRPMLYLAADSGMRPQEYLAVARSDFKDGGVEVKRAIERPGTRLSVTKTKAGRRFIDLSPEVYEMIMQYINYHTIENRHDLVFPTSTGHWQSTDHWRRRGFNVACMEAGLSVEKEEAGKTVLKNKYSPYDLRHFYASVLFDSKMNNKVNLKRIQTLMGHSNIKTTLNTYGHLLVRSEAEANDRGGMLSSIAHI